VSKFCCQSASGAGEYLSSFYCLVFCFFFFGVCMCSWIPILDHEDIGCR
jgi:hypothetical protein